MRIVFMGTGEIALPSLDWLLEESSIDLVGVFTQPDKPVGRKQELTRPEIKVRAEKAGVPVFQPTSFKKEPEAIEALQELKCDIAVVMAYGQILPKAVINAPKIACVNLHASLLPRHRGASPIQASIRDGDSETGITLMHIAPKLDAGDMILKSAIPIAPTETGGMLHDRLAELGPSILADGLPLIFSGEAEREVQGESEVTYSGKLGREDGELDWQQSAEKLERLVRAYDPWPGTSTIWPGGKKPKKLKLFPPVEIDEAPVRDAEAGAISEENGVLKVACGGGCGLKFIGEMQLEGKKRMPISDFLKGANLQSGIKLG